MNRFFSSYIFLRASDKVKKEAKEKVRVFDNRGLTYDRYTIIIGKDVYTMNENPSDYNGFNQYSHTIKGNIDDYILLLREMNEIEIKIKDLPEQVKKAIKAREA